MLLKLDKLLDKLILSIIRKCFKNKHMQWLMSLLYTVMLSTAVFVIWEVGLSSSFKIWFDNNLYYTYFNLYTLMWMSLLFKWGFFVAVGLSILHISYFFKFKGNNIFLTEEREALVNKLKSFEEKNQEITNKSLEHYKEKLNKERLNRVILQNVPIPILVLNKDRVIIDCNKAMEIFSGYQKEAILHKMRIDEFISKPDDKTEVIEGNLLQEEHATYSISEYNFIFKTRYKVDKHIKLSTKVVTGTDNSIVTIVDETERLQLEDMVEMQNHLTRDIIKSSQKYIWEKDIYGRYVFCDANFCNDFFGIASELNCTKALGFTDIELVEFYKQNTGNIHAFGDACVSTDKFTEEKGKPCRFIEMGIIDKKLFIIEVIKTPNYDNFGEYIGIFGSATNRTNEGQNVILEVDRCLRQSTMTCLHKIDGLLGIYYVHYDTVFKPLEVDEVKKIKMPGRM